MTVFSKPKSLSSYIVMQPKHLIHCNDDYECTIDTEIQALRKKILKEKSPGAMMLVRRMQAVDAALMLLHEDLQKFTPEEYHKNYAADICTRRYIYLKVCYVLSVLDHVQREIERRAGGFHLTHENTHVVPEPAWAADARAWQRRYRLEQAREARGEHSTRRRAAVRKVVTSVTSSAPSMVDQKTRAKAGS